MKKIVLFFVILLLAFSSSNLFAKDIDIVTDENFWYPFTFVRDNQSQGLHIDIVKKALENLGYTVKFHQAAWETCLTSARNGVYDAIVSASYKEDRAKYLFYPSDAATSKKSDFRITQVEYVVVSNIDDPYVFNPKEIKSLPQPVCAPKGYSVVADLRAEGVNVIENKDDIKSFLDITNQKKGVVISIPESVNYLIKKTSSFQGKLKIQKEPYKTKSYFIAFSQKKNVITESERKAIWEEIAKVRDNEQLMETFMKKY